MLQKQHNFSYALIYCKYCVISNPDFILHVLKSPKKNCMKEKKNLKIIK